MRVPFKMDFVIFMILILSVGLNAQSFSVDEYTVALWNFDEGEGVKVNDVSPTGNALQYNVRADRKPDDSPPKWVRGKYGKALLFDSALRQQFTGGKKPFCLSNAVTIEAWIKPEGSGNVGFFQNMSYAQSGFRVNFSGLKVMFCLQTSNRELQVISKKPLVAGEWSHFACTYDGKAAKIYLNGFLDHELAYDCAVVQSSETSIRLGDTGGWAFFSGAIDSIRISKIARADFSAK